VIQFIHNSSTKFTCLKDRTMSFSQSTDKSQESQFESPAQSQQSQNGDQLSPSSEPHREYKFPDRNAWNAGQDVTITEVKIKPGKDEKGYVGTVQKDLEQQQQQQRDGHNDGNDSPGE